MNPKQIQKIESNVVHMRDALLGGFMVQALKEEDPQEYESLLAYFSHKQEFIDALNDMNDQIDFGGVEA